MSEYEQIIDEIVKHGVVVKVNKIVDDNYIPYERKYVGCVVELDFSEHDKVFEDKITDLEQRIRELIKEKDEYKRKCNNFGFENQDLKKIIKDYEDKIDELEKAVVNYKQAFEDKCKDYKTTSELIGKYQQENESLKKRVVELEDFSCQAEQETESLVEKLNQRIVKLEKSRSEWIDKTVEWQQKCEKLESKETEICENEPISDDCRPSMEWYENRHQSDCIEINRLNTTIDVLIHKVEYLRQFAGLE